MPTLTLHTPLPLNPTSISFAGLNLVSSKDPHGGRDITIPEFFLVSLLVFSTVNSFYVDKGFYLFYMLSFPSLMTLATRIHKIRLSTLYREENNKLH